MKRTAFTLMLTAVVTGFSLSLQAQDERYQQAMKKNLATLDTTATAAGFQELGNTFARIAEAEKDKWLPYYYAAYSQVMQAFINQKDKDMMREKADEAEKLIGRADELSPDNAEVRCIQSLILSVRISVNPAVNGPVYGPRSGEILEEAIRLAPENPRPHLLMGQALFYTPPMFGGGKEKALPHIQTALEKFETYQAESPLHPHWGKELADDLIAQAKN